MKQSLLELVSGDRNWRYWYKLCDEVHERIAAGESATGTDADGEGFLHKIAGLVVNTDKLANYEEAVRYAVEQGCSFTAQNKEDCTPIHFAAFEWEPHFIDFAIKYAPEQVAAALNMPDKHGNTPLHWFCGHGKMELWKRALALGANPYLKNQRGELPREQVSNSGSLTASGKKKFLALIEKTTKNIPNPDAAKVEPIAPAAWKIELSDSAPQLRGTQLFELDGWSCASFRGVSDSGALILSERYYLGMNLGTGAIEWRQKRFHLDEVDNSVAVDGVWYGNVSDSGTLNGYVIAIDPLKGFNPATGEALWLTKIGGWKASRAVVVIDGGQIFLNTSSSLLALDRRSGKLLWRAKPAGCDESVSPFICGGHVYVQCKKGKQIFAAAFDPKTGAAVESRNFPLPLSIAEWTSEFYHSRPVMWEGKLLYFTRDGGDHAVLLNPADGQVLASMPLPFMGNFFVENGVMYLNIRGASARVDLTTGKVETEPDLSLSDRPALICHATASRLYVSAQARKDTAAAVEIYERATGKLIHKIALPTRAARLNKAGSPVGKHGLFVTASGVIYAHSLFEDEQEKAWLEVSAVC